MAFVTTIDGDLQVNGSATFGGSPTFGTGTLDNSHIKQSAKIEATKVRQILTYSGNQLGSAVADTIPFGNLMRAGTVVKASVSVGTAATGTTSTTDFNIQIINTVSPVVAVSILSGGAVSLGAGAGLADGEKLTLTLTTDATSTYDPVTEEGVLRVVISNVAAGDGAVPVDLAWTIEFLTNE